MNAIVAVDNNWAIGCQNPGGSQEFQTGDDRQGGGAWEKDT